MIGLLLKNPYVLLFAVLSLIGALGGYGLWMYQKGEKACQERQKTEIIQSLTQREKIEHENQNIDRNTIIRNLERDGWLRNSE